MSLNHVDSPLELAQLKLKRLERQLTTLLTSLPEPVCIFSLGGKCLEVLGSSSLIQHTHFSDFKGKQVADLFKPELAKLIQTQISLAATTKKVATFEYALTPLGTECVGTEQSETWFQGRMTPIIETDGTVQSVSWLSFNVSDKKQLEQCLADQAATDPLTSTLNRTVFLHHINELFTQFKHEGSPFSLLLFDLDHFKKINDRYDHEVGDQVIKHMVATLSNELRSSDILARLDGGDFGLLLPNTDASRALGIAERHRALIAAMSYQHDQELIDYSASIGLSSIDNSDQSAQSLMKRAEIALNHAKRSGRNRVSYQ